MSNPILEKIDEFGKAVHEMREANDRRLEKLEKGQESRAKELDIQADRWNTKIDESLKLLSALRVENEAQKTRLELLEALADRPKGTPEEQLKAKELKTWTAFLRSGFQDSNIKSQLQEVRKQMREIEQKTDSVLIGSALLGGNAVPTVIGSAIERLELAYSDVVGLVTTRNLSSSDNYGELVSIAGTNGGWAAESGSRSQTNAPNWRKVTPTHGELFALPRVSNWSLQDIMFDVVGQLTQDIAETMAITKSTAIYSGSGSSQPTGIVHSAPTSSNDYASPQRAAAVFQYVATGSSPITAVTADMIIDLQYKLRPRYQMNARWFMNTTTQAFVRKLKDDYGQYLWQMNLQAGQPPTLLGKPIATWEDLGATTSGNAFPIAYGDMARAYLWTNIGGMTMITDNVTVPGFTNFYVAQRSGGIPRNHNALKLLKIAAS